MKKQHYYPDIKPDKSFASLLWCYCSIQNNFKAWLQKETIPHLPNVVSSHLASTVITALLLDYKLWIVFRNLQMHIFFAKREQAHNICSLMYTHTIKWNQHFYNFIITHSKHLTQMYLNNTVLFLYVKNLSPHLTPRLFPGVFL